MFFLKYIEGRYNVNTANALKYNYLKNFDGKIFKKLSSRRTEK